MQLTKDQIAFLKNQKKQGFDVKTAWKNFQNAFAGSLAYTPFSAVPEVGKRAVDIFRGAGANISAGASKIGQGLSNIAGAFSPNTFVADPKIIKYIFRETIARVPKITKPAVQNKIFFIIIIIIISPLN